MFLVHGAQSNEGERGSFYRLLEKIYVQMPGVWLPLVHMVP